MGVVKHCFVAALLLTALPLLIAQEPSCAGATLLIRNAHIITMDAKQTIAEAMVIRAGRILCVGSDADVESCSTSNTEIVDSRGRTVLPGLIDVHTHAQEWAKSIAKGEIDLNFPKVK